MLKKYRSDHDRLLAVYGPDKGLIKAWYRLAISLV